MHGVYATSSGEVAEDHLVGADADNRAVNHKELLDGLTLLKTQDVCCNPEIGNGRIPGTRDGAERREEEVVDSANEDGCECNGGGSEEKVVREPRDGGKGRRFHCGEDRVSKINMVYEEEPASLQGRSGCRLAVGIVGGKEEVG